MQIQIYPSVLLNSDEELSKLSQQQLHIICPALKKGHYCMRYLTAIGMAIDKVTEFCDIVNVKQDPGCLYPKYSFTIFPAYKEQTHDQLRKYFKEVIKAQSDYFKQIPEMLFAFDKDSFPDFVMLKSILQEVLDEQKHKLTNLKAVYFFPSTN